MGSVGTKADEMNVPYDEWGPRLDNELIYENREDGRWVVGSIYDRQEVEWEPYIQKVTKSELLGDIDAWKQEDGTYGSGDGDEAFYIIYEDGKTLDLTDGLPHKRWSKQGIIGVYYSDSDTSAVWGDDWITNTNGYGRERTPLTVEEHDKNFDPTGKLFTNSRQGYKQLKVRWKRIEERYDAETKQRARKVIRQSTWSNY